MITLSAPSGASEPLAHAIELVNRDLDGLLDHLDTKQQNEFWANLHQFALAETRGEDRSARLMAAERQIRDTKRPKAWHGGGGESA